MEKLKAMEGFNQVRAVERDLESKIIKFQVH